MRLSREERLDGMVSEKGSAMSAHSRGKIAVADDDDGVRTSLAALLEAYGFEVRTFASGAYLLRGHAAEPAHCLMLDQLMPVVTGLKVLQTLRERGDTTPVILITGVPNRALYAKAKSLGATAILYKPIPPAELMIAVKQAVASRRR